MKSDYSLKESAIQIFALPIAVARKFRADRLTRHAAALSYSSLLALAPIMVIVFSIFSMFSSFGQVGDAFEEFIFKFLLPSSGENLKQYLQLFADQAGQLTLIGLGLFLLTALMLLFTIEESFNDIWGLRVGRAFSSRMVVYWALVTLGPILMGASLSISTYLIGLTVSQNFGFTAQVHSAGLSLLPILFELLAFLLLYTVMPNVHVRIGHAFSGAAVATLLFELTKKGFSYYVVNFNNYEVIYGALSTLPVLLIWIYLSWVVALIGAEVVAVLQYRNSGQEDSA